MHEHRVIFGDATDVLATLPATSVHLVVTSPPYWSIKDYDHPLQIGRPQSVEDYLASLERGRAECRRLLHPGCRLAINIGDQYLRARDHGRYRVLPIPAETIRACVALGLAGRARG